jgi:pimeloyl-ACP methyl ester carboxylesterase
MTSANANGITIEYEVHGEADGLPLLLVMGLGGQLVGWPIDLIDLLTAQGFRVVRYDNRDSGLSTHIDTPPPSTRQIFAALASPRRAKPSYTLADMADDAVGLLDALGIQRAHVLGISMGGMIAQTITIRHPERVASLTSIMSNPGDRKHGRPSAGLLRKMPKLMRGRREDAVENGIEMFRLISGPAFDASAARDIVTAGLARSYDPDATARQVMAILASPDRTDDLGAVTVPTLVVHGLVDPLVKSSGGIATVRAIPGARLVMYPDMGHDLPRSRWPELVEEVVRNSRRATEPAPSVPASSLA